MAYDCEFVFWEGTLEKQRRILTDCSPRTRRRREVTLGIPVQNHLRDMQRYVANVAITPSALRNLGTGGLVRTAREFLGNLDLRPLATLDPSAYSKWLETQT